MADNNDERCGGRGSVAMAPASSPAAAAPPPLSAAWLLLWLLVAAVVPVMVALLGVFARYLQASMAWLVLQGICPPSGGSSSEALEHEPSALVQWLAVGHTCRRHESDALMASTLCVQVDTTPPFPPLRFTSAINVLALPTLLVFHTLPHCLLRMRRRRQKRSAVEGPGAASCTHIQEPELGSSASAGNGVSGERSEDGSVKLENRSCEELSKQQAPESASARSNSYTCTHSQDQSGGACGIAAPGPSLPGLVRLHRRNPAAHRTCVLLAAAGCYEVAILGQNVGPGLVDPSVGEAGVGRLEVCDGVASCAQQGSGWRLGQVGWFVAGLVHARVRISRLAHECMMNDGWCGSKCKHTCCLPPPRSHAGQPVHGRLRRRAVPDVAEDARAVGGGGACGSNHAGRGSHGACA